MQERDSLSTHLEELQASCKSTARVHEQQLSALKAQIAELEAQLAWQDQVEQVHVCACAAASAI